MLSLRRQPDAPSAPVVRSDASLRAAPVERPTVGAAAGPAIAESTDAGAEDVWARLWFQIAGREWRSLALLPATAGQSVLPVAEALARVAHSYQDGPVDVYDARHVTPAQVRDVIPEIAARVAAGERVLLALASPIARPTAIPLARRADAAVLVTPLGVAGLLETRQVVAAVGHARFMGSVVVRAS